MQDVSIRDPEAPDITGRSCGNAVIIDHPDGWQTRYCHLKQGSVLVQKGDEIDTGTPLGEIGLSGKTEFPHLHFGLFQGKTNVDPFRPEGNEACGETGSDLWVDDIAYAPGGIINIGFLDRIPKFNAIKAGTADRTTLPNDAPALVLWAHVFGARKADVLRLEITGPDGIVIDNEIVLTKPQARLFRATGRKVRTFGWSTGTYQGVATLFRNGVEIDSAKITLTIDQ